MEQWDNIICATNFSSFAATFIDSTVPGSYSKHVVQASKQQQQIAIALGKQTRWPPIDANRRIFPPSVSRIFQEPSASVNPPGERPPTTSSKSRASPPGSPTTSAYLPRGSSPGLKNLRSPPFVAVPRRPSPPFASTRSLGSRDRAEETLSPNFATAAAMINLGMESPPSASNTGTAEKAFSFLSKGWREVRDSAGADFQLMRARANKFKNLADRELENFLHSASALSTPPGPPVEGSIAELEFVKRIQPKLSEIRRAYSSPEFSRKVLEKWSPKPTIRIDLSGIRNAIVAEVDEVGAVLDLDNDRVRGRGRKVRWKGEEKWKEWEPIRLLKKRLKELERKSQSSEIFGNFKSSEFVEKVKLSLVNPYLCP